MGRLFLSLYLFIALSLIGLGTLMDKVFFPEQQQADPWLQSYARFISQQAQLPATELRKLIDKNGLNAEFNPLSDTQWTGDLLQQLQQQGYLLLDEGENNQQLLILLPEQQLLTLTQEVQPQQHNSFLLYSSMFFLAFGLLLVLWTWPVWRDLSTLNQASRSLKQDGSLPQVNLNKTSVIYPIATSFNALAQQIKQLLLTQKELTGAVAHEFRTPLARLKFALAVKPEFASADWQAMGQDVDELERLTQEMLDYAAMESTQPELSMAEVPIRFLCQSVIDRLTASHFKQLQVKLSGDEHILFVDGHLIERAIQNILINASRYAATQIDVEIKQQAGQLYIYIADDGPGIPVAHRQQVFEPFYRPDHARDRKRGGAGLGLAIVKRIQLWHQGQCSVSESANGGACFILSYPYQKQQTET